MLFPFRAPSSASRVYHAFRVHGVFQVSMMAHHEGHEDHEGTSLFCSALRVPRSEFTVRSAFRVCHAFHVQIPRPLATLAQARQARKEKTEIWSSSWRSWRPWREACFFRSALRVPPSAFVMRSTFKSLARLLRSLKHAKLAKRKQKSGVLLGALGVLGVRHAFSVPRSEFRLPRL